MRKELTEKGPNPGDFTGRAFKIGLYVKGLDGVLETLGGLLLLFIKPSQINHLAGWLTQGQLSQNPHDYLANHILKTAHQLTGASLIFGAVYLLSQGLIKVFLVYQVLHDRIWAYKLLIVVISLFVIYQVYRLSLVKFSISLTLLTVFDLAIIYLTQKEYRRHQAARA